MAPFPNNSVRASFRPKRKRHRRNSKRYNAHPTTCTSLRVKPDANKRPKRTPNHDYNCHCTSIIQDPSNSTNNSSPMPRQPARRSNGIFANIQITTQMSVNPCPKRRYTTTICRFQSYIPPQELSSRQTSFSHIFSQNAQPPSNESIHAPSQSLSKRPIGKKRLKKTDNWAFFSSNETFHREQKRLRIKKCRKINHY